VEPQLTEILDEVLVRIGRSRFRAKFRLQGKELAYLETWGMARVIEDGRRFITTRLAPAQPRNDGRQTPWRNHPIFVAQHATATCCRGCLEKNHGIAKGTALTPEQIDYVLAVLERWMHKYCSDVSGRQRSFLL
jgi:hypothetical protein